MKNTSSDLRSRRGLLRFARNDNTSKSLSKSLSLRGDRKACQSFSVDEATPNATEGRQRRYLQHFAALLIALALSSTPCFAQGIEGLETATPVPLHTITPTATTAPTLTPTPLGSHTPTPTVTPTVTNTPTITQTPTITPTPTPFEINCNNPALLYDLAKLASGDFLENIPRPGFAKRIRDDCMEYYKQRESGEAGRPDSVADLWNAIRPQVEARMQAINARLKANPNDKLKDFEIEHPYKFGSDWDDWIEVQIDDFVDYAFGGSFFDCFDLHIKGFCVDFEWVTVGFIPLYLPVAADLWTTYRWEWGKEQGQEHGWENAHMPRDLEIIKLGLEADDYLTYDTATITALMGTDRHVVKQGVKNTYALLKLIPGVNMPDVEDVVESGSLPDGIRDLLRTGPAGDPESRWKNVQLSGFSRAKDATITRSYTDFLLGPVLDRIPLFGLKHNMKWNPLYMLMPLSSKGGAFFIQTRPLRDSVAADLAGAAFAGAASAIEFAALVGMPVACQYLDTLQQPGHIARLQTPADMLLPVPDPTGAVMQQVSNTGVPGTSFKIRDLAKFCSRSGQGAVAPYTAIDHNATDNRTAMEKQMLKFTRTMDMIYPFLSFIMYQHNDESEKEGHDDRVLWYDDKVFEDNLFDPDSDDGSCQRFYAKTLREDREPGRDDPQKGFRLTNRNLSENGKLFPETDDLGHEKVDVRWANMGLHKRFKGCGYKGDWDWTVCPGCPDEILN